MNVLTIILALSSFICGMVVGIIAMILAKRMRPGVENIYTDNAAK